MKPPIYSSHPLGQAHQFVGRQFAVVRPLIRPSATFSPEAEKESPSAPAHCSPSTP
ncbi:MAG: hypothetical protein QGF56_04875 [Verrucomicrobiota bacterium]|nr:hypothetical protein [Verrucomicrobiota bacterium]MDP6753000.1 hypothetical protein [Verrucomicrobiota bacterium]